MKLALWISLIATLSGCFWKAEKKPQKTTHYETRAAEIYKERKVERSQALTSDDTVIRQGTHMMILVDNDCMRGQNGGDFSQQVSDGQRHDALSLQYYTYYPEQDTTVAALEARCRADRCIVGASESGTMRASFVVNDPNAPISDHLRQTRASEGWDWFYSAVNGVTATTVVAVLDTGVNQNHEDLQSRLWDDGNGNNGFDFINNDNNPDDDQGHGTHVAGLIAAQTNNALGVTGISGSFTEIMGIKVLGADGSGTFEAIINGINYAAQNGADIINLSLGGPGTVAAMQVALEDAVASGVFVVAAAGNEGRSLNVSPTFPAQYARDLDGMMSVGSVDSFNEQRSGFSNFSADFVELFAPGAENGPQGLASTYLGANGYARLAGTSMASPVVAGAAALAIGWMRTHQIADTPALTEEILFTGSPVNQALINLGKEGRYLKLRSLAIELANRFGNDVAVPVNYAPEIDLASATGPVLLGHGSSFSFDIQVSGSPAPTFQWFRNGVAIPGATSPTLSFEPVDWRHRGTYRLDVTNIAGTVQTQNFNVSLQPISRFPNESGSDAGMEYE